VADVGRLAISRAQVAAAVDRLRQTLATGTVSQQKKFIRSFVRKIVYEFPKVTIYYEFPIDPRFPGGGGEPGQEEISIGSGQRVLGIDKKGSSDGTRTYNPPG
jgi:hypothetical protein